MNINKQNEPEIESAALEFLHVCISTWVHAVVAVYDSQLEIDDFSHLSKTHLCLRCGRIARDRPTE